MFIILCVLFIVLVLRAYTVRNASLHAAICICKRSDSFPELQRPTEVVHSSVLNGIFLPQFAIEHTRVPIGSICLLCHGCVLGTVSHLRWSRNFRGKFTIISLAVLHDLRTRYVTEWLSRLFAIPGPLNAGYPVTVFGPRGLYVCRLPVKVKLTGNYSLVS